MVVSSIGDIKVHCVRVRGRQLSYSISYKQERIAGVVVSGEDMKEIIYDRASIELTEEPTKEAKMACVNIYMALMHLVGTPRYLAKEDNLTGEALQDYRYREAIRMIFITHGCILKPINAFTHKNRSAITEELRRNRRIDEDTRVFIVGTYSLEALSKCICRKTVTNISSYITPFIIALPDEDFDIVSREVIYKKVLANLFKTIDKKEKEYIQFITDRQNIPNMSVDFLLGGVVSARQ